MSPNVNSFVHDLVAMATAMDRLPVVERELSEAQAREEHLNLDINSLKADLEQSRNYAASLEQKVRTTEAERDDAEIRFLEVEDRLSSVVNSFRAMQATLGQAVDVLDPPKPQPEPVVEQRVPDPEPSQYPHAGHGYDNPPIPEAVHSIEPQPQGQGEALPTNPVTEQTTSVSGNDAKNLDASSIDKPYANKRYIEVDGHISRWDWTMGGGTDESYDWRPAVG